MITSPAGAGADHRKGNGAAQRDLFQVQPEGSVDANASQLRGVCRRLWRSNKLTYSTRFRLTARGGPRYGRGLAAAIRIWHGRPQAKE